MKKKSSGELVHIRIGKELRAYINYLIDIGLFSNQAELTREALRNLVLKYAEEIKRLQKHGKNKQ